MWIAPDKKNTRTLDFRHSRVYMIPQVFVYTPGSGVYDFLGFHIPAGPCHAGQLGTGIHFRMEFDHYSGSLNNFYLGFTHYFSDTIGAGIGYNVYLMNLDSADDDLRGSLKMRHHGPIVFASFNF